MRLHIARSWILLPAIVAALGTFGCGDSNTPVGPTSGESSGSGGSGSRRHLWRQRLYERWLGPPHDWNNGLAVQ